MPSEVVEKARKHGINVSKVSENVLIDMINRIKGSEKKEDPAFSVKAFPKRFEWAGWESNPDNLGDISRNLLSSIFFFSPSDRFQGFRCDNWATCTPKICHRSELSGETMSTSNTRSKR